jgi:hypothetical protein
LARRCRLTPNANDHMFGFGNVVGDGDDAEQ